MTRNSHYAIIVALMVLLVATAGFAGCTGTTPTQQTTPTATVTTTQPVSTPVATQSVTAVPTMAKPTGPPQTLLVATTTSLYDTGLLDYLQPMFEKQTGDKLKITSQGTGKAIELAKRGDADILLVHDPASEMLFMENGTGLNRRSFADNYFEIVGPASDPAGINGMTPEDAFKKIMAEGKKGTPGVAFVSRGDGSGTQSAEKRIWANAKYNYAKDVQNSGKWYIEAGKGMGETLQMASEKGAYTLTDEGTYLAYKGKLNLEPIITTGDSLLNVYSVMTVYNAKQPVEKISAANDFVNFLIAPGTQAAIAAYGKEKYGKSLFTPMSAGVPKGIPAGIVVDYTTPAVATKPLIIFNAGSLTNSFTKVAVLYAKAHPDTDVQIYSGATSAMIDKITKNGEKSDILGSADAVLIPKQMFPTYADYYVKFAKNSMVLMYTNQSKYANEITSDNWYKILERDGVRVVTSDPNTDPGGYRAYQAVKLAERYYGLDNIFSTIIGSHSKITTSAVDGAYVIDVTNANPDGKGLIIAATGPKPIDLLKAGSADYYLGYMNTAVENKVSYISLPPEMDLSNPAMADKYATVKIKRTLGTGTTLETGIPIEYGITVPTVAVNPSAGIQFIQLLLSSDGQAILTGNGLPPIVPPTGFGKVPSSLMPPVVKG
jgi:tungstate transport system substrate-binding protein